MKKLLPLLSLVFATHCMTGMISTRSFISSLQVNDDSTWTIVSYNIFLEEDIPDTVAISGTAGSFDFIFTEEIKAEIKDKADSEFYLKFANDGASVSVTLIDQDGELTELFSQTDNLNIFPLSDKIILKTVSQVETDIDSVVYGGNAYFPSLGGTKAYNCALTDCGLLSYWYSEEGKENIHPVTLKGKVYGKDGELLKGFSLYSDYNTSGYPCSSTNLDLGSEGTYQAVLQYPLDEINTLIYTSSELQIAPSSGKIEPISLADAVFGAVVEADIYFVDNLTAIDEQLSVPFIIENDNFILQENVQKCSVIDILGKETVLESSIIPLQQFRSGVYVIVAVLENGKTVVKKAVF